MTKHMIVMVGIPGSGKSTYANNLNGYTVISSDSIRKEYFGDENDQTHNNQVFIILRDKLHKALRAGENICVDATNITVKSRKGYIDVANEYGYTIDAVVFLPNRELCIERDKNRERTVGEAVIDKMIKKFVLPTEAEGFSAVLVLNDKEKA